MLGINIRSSRSSVRLPYSKSSTTFKKRSRSARSSLSKTSTNRSRHSNWKRRSKPSTREGKLTSRMSYSRTPRTISIRNRSINKTRRKYWNQKPKTSYRITNMRTRRSKLSIQRAVSANKINRFRPYSLILKLSLQVSRQIVRRYTIIFWRL